MSLITRSLGLLTFSAGLLLVNGTGPLDAAHAQTADPSSTTDWRRNNASEDRTGPLGRQEIPASKQADAWFENYGFRSGETLARLRIHYATLGSPHRDARGDIDNAVLVLHWTGADGLVLLTPTYMKALFDPGRPLDANRYYLIFPDNVGHGQSSKPSDGLKADSRTTVMGTSSICSIGSSPRPLGSSTSTPSSASRWAA
jgi:homoserine O-acetyltransferase/O-succinyltransferase